MQKTTHKSQMARLSRIEGQVRGIKKMVEDERYCVDILLQLRSVINALGKVQENIFRHHLEGCVHDSLAGGDGNEKEKKIEEILDLIFEISDSIGEAMENTFLIVFILFIAYKFFTGGG